MFESERRITMLVVVTIFLDKEEPKLDLIVVLGLPLAHRQGLSIAICRSKCQSESEMNILNIYIDNVHIWTTNTLLHG